MPVVFDTYSKCSYQCLYCFAYYQKALGTSRRATYQHGDVESLNITKAKALFAGQAPGHSSFRTYFAERKTVQWGGMSDPFDEYERKHGVTLGILRWLRETGNDYQICFSTKGTWWTEDPRYAEAFRGAKNLNVKVSVITLDEHKARGVELGVPEPAERLRAMERIASWGAGGVTLRLRPFLIGISNPTHVPLIKAAAAAGASALSTEFYCLEQRAPNNGERVDRMSKAAGIDLLAFYRKQSHGSGYLRLNREVKRPFVEQMQEACSEVGLRFYVSDAHFKELCANGSCCGLPPEFNYSRGQLCEALCVARRNGRVYWSDISENMGHLGFPFVGAEGHNTCSNEVRAKFRGFSMRDYLHYLWNHVNGGKSPYRYTEGILVPDGRDEQGDVIYRYAGE